MKQQQQQQNQEEISDEEALMRVAAAMKDSAGVPDEKHSVPSFLFNVVKAPDSTKVGNLRNEADNDELGKPTFTVRGAKELQLISKEIMGNDFFASYFEKESENALATSLSRDGFLIRQVNLQTKQVADITKRRTINKGWFGQKKIQESGGDTVSSTSSNN
jgi:hypothetical protein